VRLVRFTERGRSRRQVSRLHLRLAERPGNPHGAYSVSNKYLR